jgi:hypothetical protein
MKVAWGKMRQKQGNEGRSRGEERRGEEKEDETKRREREEVTDLVSALVVCDNLR